MYTKTTASSNVVTRLTLRPILQTFKDWETVLQEHLRTVILPINPEAVFIYHYI